jgi:hypothetical protein
MEKSSQLHTLATLPSGVKPPSTLRQENGGPQSWSGCGGKETSPCPCHKLNPGHPSCSLATILTQLSQFSPEDGGSMILWNVGIYLQVHLALQPRRPTLTTSPLWEPCMLMSNFYNFVLYGQSSSNFVTIPTHANLLCKTSQYCPCQYSSLFVHFLFNKNTTYFYMFLVQRHSRLYFY